VSYDCRRLLKVASKHEDGILTESLGKKLGVNVSGIGGMLLSLGRVLKKRKYDNLQYPFDWTKDGKYKMIAVWKEMVTNLINEEGQIV
jgi:hypothetical protein